MSQIVHYEAGYTVCLILVVLYMLIMPVVGGMLAWNFFHSSTVAVIDRSSPLSSPWYKKDITVITCLSIVAVLLLVGVFLTFTTNNRVHENMSPSLNHLRNDISYVENAFKSIQKKINTIIKQFSVPQEEIIRDLEGMGNLIGSTVVSSFNTQVNNALFHIAHTIQDASRAQGSLQILEETRISMQTRHSYLESELRWLQSRLHSLKNNCSQSCELLEGTDLESDANYYLIPSLDEQLQHLSSVSALEGVVEQGNISFYSIPQNYISQTAPKIAALVVDFNETREFFKNSSDQIPSLDSLSTTASGVLSILNRYHRDIKYYEYIRWSLSVVFCTLILVIALLMFAGLVICVPLIFFPAVYPVYLNNQLRLSAIYLLRVAAGMIFIFTWLFIIMVFITLFFGGNAYTLGCKAWTSGKIFEFLDTQENLFSSLNTIAEFNAIHASNSNTTHKKHSLTTTDASTMQMLNITQTANGTTNDTLPKLNIKTSEIYHGCRAGRSMFYTMKMDEVFNMDVFLNTSKYLESFEGTLQDMSIDLDSTTLLPEDGRYAVQSFRDSGLDTINYDGLRVLMSKSVVKRDLAAFADELDTAAALPENEAIRDDMQREANHARYLNTVVQEQNTDRSRMNSSVEALAIISQDYKSNADNTLQYTSETQAALHNETPYIIANVSLCAMNKAEEVLQHYMNWVRHAIISEVLDCQWLSVSLSNVYTATCENVIDPWNAFWLCLGWCCAFLVLGVIFCIFTSRLLELLPSNKASFYVPKDIFDTETHSKSYKTKDYMEDEDTENIKSNI
ncbi:prominin-2-like isoform X1 [Myxocyprinus asiaticus]|uniref:prominin-2-like isoform X1 n=1 Tax=Myxocyprinus asiaticus TaxID=70543 RepID=UPI0022213C30|nr:prominin-2-like isoform X1 [Myxocyprinus asiaticus]